MRPSVSCIALLLLTAGPVSPYEGVPVDGGATVHGTVRLAGTPPRLAPREVFKHREVCGKSVGNESLVLGPKQSLRYAVVSLDGIARGKPVERDAVNLLGNRKCRFTPHVIAASVGQWLLLGNDDPILHNADAFDTESRRTVFNVALPPGKEIRRPLAAAGRMRVVCDVRHTWMEAFVVVAEHPYVTVTDAEGSYELRDVPAGTHALRVWHELLGTLERTVTVGKGASHVEDVVYSAAE